MPPGKWPSGYYVVYHESLDTIAGPFAREQRAQEIRDEHNRLGYTLAKVIQR